MIRVARKVPGYRPIDKFSSVRLKYINVSFFGQALSYAGLNTWASVFHDVRPSGDLGARK